MQRMRAGGSAISAPDLSEGYFTQVRRGVVKGPAEARRFCSNGSPTAAALNWMN